jgi:hypothetical protein
MRRRPASVQDAGLFFQLPLRPPQLLLQLQFFGRLALPIGTLLVGVVFIDAGATCAGRDNVPVEPIGRLRP